MIIVRQFIFLAQVTTFLFCQNALAETITGAQNTVAPDMEIQQADCIDFINENPARVRCGFIELPVDHNAPADGLVTLPILIAGQTRTLSAAPSDKAILIPGGGGPGASIGFALPYQPNEYLGIYDSLRAAGFDLVILDQRGAGFAKPVLRCPETVAAFIDSAGSELTLSKTLEIYSDSLNACRRTLESQQIALTHFDTYQSARDFLAVISQLPYEWWGTLATSYATVIAQAMEVIEPGVFDRLVLDSPVAIDFQKPFTFEVTEASIERILSLCEITRRCNQRHKKIKVKFKELLQRTRETPLSLDLKIVDGNSGVESKTLLVDDNILLDMLILAAYSNYSITEIPWVIDELYKKKTHRLKELATDYWYYNTDLDFASALSWTIHCKERQPLEENYLRRHPQAAEKHSTNTKLAIKSEQSICRDWNVPGASITAVENRFTPETLIVAGDLDPVISREDINRTADKFINKQVMILPGTGHSVWFQSECTRANTLEFFNYGSNSTLTECTDGIRRFK